MKAKPRERRADTAAPRLRRAYFECRFGQLHVRDAMPSGGGFDEETALLCFHQSPASSRVFSRFLALMGHDRSIYAPDTPGFGESDAPPAQPSIGDYAGAMVDFLDTMRLRQVDLLGVHTGAAIATELAVARPQVVRRLMLVGVPLFTDAERTAFRSAPWPLPPAEDGSHLMQEWRRSLGSRGPGVTLEMLAASFAEKLRNGPKAFWGAEAVMSYALRERLAELRQPVMVIRPQDDLWSATARAREVLRGARFVDLPELGHGLFDVAPERIVALAREFLAR